MKQGPTPDVNGGGATTSPGKGPIMSKVTLWEARGEYLAHLTAQQLAPATIRAHATVLDHAVNTWGDIDLRYIDTERAERNALLGGRPMFIDNEQPAALAA